MSLTFKQESFCREYVRCKGNATEAVRRAYNIKTDNARAVTGYRLLRKANIRGRLSELLDAGDISFGALCQSLKKGLEAKKPLLVNGKIVLVDDNMAILETVELVYRLYGLL